MEAVDKGMAPVVDRPTQFTISGTSRDSDNLYGFATSLTRAKQEYWGDDKSYLFDPATERYERVDNMTLARWYPTLVGLKDGRVLSVSGLDEFGRIIEGDNEIYDPETKQWKAQPQLKRTFPTYPSLFLMPSGKLFYTGSNAGYGSDTVGRHPGHLGPERQLVHEGARAARPAPDGDQRERPAAARAGPALHARRGRGHRRVQPLDGPHRRDRPAREEAALRARAQISSSRCATRTWSSRRTTRS